MAACAAMTQRGDVVTFSTSCLSRRRHKTYVMPAEAGIRVMLQRGCVIERASPLMLAWIPACAGLTYGGKLPTLPLRAALR